MKSMTVAMCILAVAGVAMAQDVPSSKPHDVAPGIVTPQPYDASGGEDMPLSVTDPKPSPDNYESVSAPVGWRFLVGLPVWIPGVDGDMSVDGFSFSADQDTSDVVDNMDDHINGAAGLHLE